MQKELVTIYQTHWRERTPSTKGEGAMTTTGGTREDFLGELMLEAQP